MANTFLTCQEIARQALPLLHDNLVFPALIHKDYSNEFHKKGDTIQVRKPAKFSANEFTGTISAQDANEDSVLVKLDKIADVSVVLTAKEMALNIEDFSSQILQPAMLAIAEKINRDGLKMYKDIPEANTIGTAGTTPSTLADIAQGAKVLNLNKAHMDGRNAVWDAEALAAFQVLDAVVHAEKSGSTAALREGSIGRLLGVNNYMSQAVAQDEEGAFTANMMFHKNAFSFVNRPLEVARGVESYVTSHNGLSIRVTFGYDMKTKEQTMSIDCLYGYQTMYPELACVVKG
jgi:hypothetical protein